MRRSLSLAALCVAVLLLCSGARAENWPRFRGPNGQGLSDATTLPVKWTAQDYNWKVKLPGEGHSSPVVWEDRIYVTCAGASATRIVSCLNVADGRILWQRDFPSHKYGQNAQNGFATASPAADGEGVVVAWTTPEEVTLLVLDREGKDAWRRNLGPFVSMHGSGTSPIILNDLVILSNEQGDVNTIKKPAEAPKSVILAFDRRTGKTRWELPRRVTIAVYATPCIWQAPNGQTQLIFISMSHGFSGVDPATGKVLWETKDILKECVGSPVLAGDLAIAGDSYFEQGGHYVAVKMPSQADQQPTIAWEIPKPVPRVTTPVIYKDRLYLFSETGAITCHDVSNGKEIWRERVPVGFYSSPVCVNGRIYCIARNGDVMVFPTGDKYELLARIPLGEPTFATPAISNGVMYLRTRSQLFSLGGKKQ
ncbi:MAG TPA: PQQ-binding-like beta-propeller repeat protein [Planctomycetota bacterium]|jgi:outer membrane protein assembly factor BamB